MRRQTAYIIRDESAQSVMHDQALLLEMLIYQLGHDLVGASSFNNEALKQIADQRPDIIWLDTPFKNSHDGSAIARQIRRIYNPVIIGLTPGNKSEQESKSQRKSAKTRKSMVRELSGFTHCFSKPISFSKVKASVQGAV
ncbi:MAG: hypothetical protein R3283_09735 [Balneolaceae bacterium]|nr:hypothetical protein [Balneolaceae bacterium]